MNEKLEKYKNNFIESLEEQIYRKEVNSAFDLARIPEVEKLKTERMEEHDKITKEIEGIDPKDTSKETRVKRKGLVARQSQLEELSLQCDETIAQIKGNVLKDNDLVKFLRLRIEFAKTWEPEVEKQAEKTS